MHFYFSSFTYKTVSYLEDKMKCYNLFDFDGTIYDGDSTVDFFLFCIKEYPVCICRVPQMALGFVKYRLRLCDKMRLKEHFFSFLKQVPNIDDAVQHFWKKNDGRIKAFYRNRSHERDIIISASPEFLLSPICREIGVAHLIASRVNRKTGVFESENCYGEEKVKRLQSELGECEIEEFYSDSKSDLPLAKMVQRAYIVKKDIIQEWNLGRMDK